MITETNSKLRHDVVIPTNYLTVFSKIAYYLYIDSNFLRILIINLITWTNDLFIANEYFLSETIKTGFIKTHLFTVSFLQYFATV